MNYSNEFNFSKTKRSTSKLKLDPNQTNHLQQILPTQINNLFINELKLRSNKKHLSRNVSISKEILWGSTLSKIVELSAAAEARAENNDSSLDKIEEQEYDDEEELNVWKQRLEIPNFWKTFTGVSLLRRIGWIIIFIISFGLFLLQTADRVLMLIDSPKSSTVALAYERQLSFPSMTICPSYKFRTSILEKFNVDRFGCKPGQRVCSWDIPYNLATHTETIIKLCTYKKHYSCSPGTEESGKWHRTITSLGRCFTYRASEPIYSGGDSNAFEIMVDPILWDKWGNGSGIRVYIHGHDEIPLVEINGININHGSSAIFSLQVKEFNRVNDVRRNLCTTTSNYSQSKCIMSCMYDLVRERANTSCGAPFMQTFDIKACLEREEIIHFVETFDIVINNGSDWNNCNDKCQEPCQQTTYTPITTSLGFAHSNSSLVNITIYFTDMWVERIIENWVYNIEEFVADTGGSLNLFLGASFVTIIQFSDYFLSIFVLWSKNFISNMKSLQNKVTTIQKDSSSPRKINSIEVSW